MYKTHHYAPGFPPLSSVLFKVNLHFRQKGNVIKPRTHNNHSGWIFIPGYLPMCSVSLPWLATGIC